MSKFILTEENVHNVYREVERRTNGYLYNGEFANENDMHEYRKAMLDGVYSALMVLSLNWDKVRFLCDEEERIRGYFKDEQS